MIYTKVQVASEKEKGENTFQTARLSSSRCMGGQVVVLLRRNNFLTRKHDAHAEKEIGKIGQLGGLISDQ